MSLKKKALVLPHDENEMVCGSNLIIFPENTADAIILIF